MPRPGPPFPALTCWCTSPHHHHYLQHHAFFQYSSAAIQCAPSLLLGLRYRGGLLGRRGVPPVAPRARRRPDPRPRASALPLPPPSTASRLAIQTDLACLPPCTIVGPGRGAALARRMDSAVRPQVRPPSLRACSSPARRWAETCCPCLLPVLSTTSTLTRPPTRLAPSGSTHSKTPSSSSQSLIPSATVTPRPTSRRRLRRRPLAASVTRPGTRVPTPLAACLRSSITSSSRPSTRRRVLATSSSSALPARRRRSGRPGGARRLRPSG
jgi:hypothetical protein